MPGSHSTRRETRAQVQHADSDSDGFEPDGESDPPRAQRDAERQSRARRPATQAIVPPNASESSTSHAGRRTESISREGPRAPSAATLTASPSLLHCDQLLERERAKTSGEVEVSPQALFESYATIRSLDEPLPNQRAVSTGIDPNLPMLLPEVRSDTVPSSTGVLSGQLELPPSNDGLRVTSGERALATRERAMREIRQHRIEWMRRQLRILQSYSRWPAYGSARITQTPAAGWSGAPTPNSTTTVTESGRSAAAAAAAAAQASSSMVAAAHEQGYVQMPDGGPSSGTSRRFRSRDQNPPSLLDRLRAPFQPVPPPPQQRALVFPVPQPGQIPRDPSPYDAIINEADGSQTHAPTRPYPHHTIFESSHPLTLRLDPALPHRHEAHLSRSYITEYAEMLDPNSARPLVPATPETIAHLHLTARQYWPTQDDDLEVERRRYRGWIEPIGLRRSSTPLLARGLTPAPIDIDNRPVCVICTHFLENGTSYSELQCGHKFCEECICGWLGRNGTCPTCRVRVVVPEERTPAQLRDDRVARGLC